MLSLLVFIFEGVRDAFDPRKTFHEAEPPRDRASPPRRVATCMRVGFRQDGRNDPGRARRVLRRGPGETVALVGESGSGKSVTALSTVRCCPTTP
jgi:ABC-type transport system involved in cytochrome bd biosynthesis fused ATPase/permease subunit